MPSDKEIQEFKELMNYYNALDKEMGIVKWRNGTPEKATREPSEIYGGFLERREQLRAELLAQQTESPYQRAYRITKFWVESMGFRHDEELMNSVINEVLTSDSNFDTAIQNIFKKLSDLLDDKRRCK